MFTGTSAQQHMRFQMHLLQFLVIIYIVILLIQSCALSPHDARQQQILKAATEELRSATNMAAASVLKAQILSNLQVTVVFIFRTLVHLSCQQVCARLGLSSNCYEFKVTRDVKSYCKQSGHKTVEYCWSSTVHILGT